MFYSCGKATGVIFIKRVLTPVLNHVSGLLGVTASKNSRQGIKMSMQDSVRIVDAMLGKYVRADPAVKTDP